MGKGVKARMKCGQVKRSSRPGKKIMVSTQSRSWWFCVARSLISVQKLYCSGGKKRLVHAGATGYKNNYSDTARKSFKARHKCSQAKPGTARHLACTQLWKKGGRKTVKGKGRKKSWMRAKKSKLKPNPCWKGYHAHGTKKKGGRRVPNCHKHGKGRRK